MELDHGCGREVFGRVSLRASCGMFLVVSDRGCGRCWKCRWRLIVEWCEVSRNLGSPIVLT